MGPDQETSFPSDSSRAVVNTNKLNPESCSTRSFISQNVPHTTSYPTTPGSPKSLWWPNDHRPEHKVLPFPTPYPCSSHPLLLLEDPPPCAPKSPPWINLCCHSCLHPSSQDYCSTLPSPNSLFHCSHKSVFWTPHTASLQGSQSQVLRQGCPAPNQKQLYHQPLLHHPSSP